jgi:hypothetical protein
MWNIKTNNNYVWCISSSNKMYWPMLSHANKTTNGKYMEYQEIRKIRHINAAVVETSLCQTPLKQPIRMCYCYK